MTTTAPERTDRLVTCGFCHADISHLFTVTTRPDGLTLDSGGMLVQGDPFGDGREHPREDFPAPEPRVNHGYRMTRDGVMLHECGTWLTPGDDL